MPHRKPDYDPTAELLKSILEQARVTGIPDEAIPPVLADFAVGIALSVGGLAAGEAILQRMRVDVAQWAVRDHPMQEMQRERREKVPQPDRAFGEQSLDLSCVRIALEHLLSYQRVSLETAALCLAVYPLLAVRDRLGVERAFALLESCRSELARLEAREDEEEGTPSNHRRPGRLNGRWVQ